MDLSPREIMSRHGELKAARSREESDWRDLASLLRPDQRPELHDAKNRPQYEDIFDSTQLYALDNFVGGIFGQLTNPANRWFEVSVEDQDLQRWQPVRQWTFDVGSRLLASLGPGVSSFYEEVPGWFSDMGAFGNGVLYQEELVGRGRIVDRVVPVGQVYFDTDASGEIDTVHREFRLSGRQMKQRFAGQLDPDRCQDQRQFTVIHCVHRNPHFDPERMGPAGMAWRSVYVCQDLRDFMPVSGFYELPYHVVRWSKRSGSAYGTGPGHVAQADIGMLQEMERSHITAAQFAAEPPLLAHDDSVINAADLVPNAILYGSVSEAGKQLLQPLNRAQNLQLSMQQSEQRRNAIREAFYYGLMQLLQRPQMTATEFLGFQQEKLQLMGPNLTRIQTGGLSPFIARRYALLERAGQLPPPPPELNGRSLQVVYQSPLAKAQQAATAQQAVNFLNQVLTYAQANPEIVDKVDFDAAVDVLHDGFGPPPSLLRDPRQVQAIRQQRAQVQAQQLQLEQAQQAVTIAAEASHAEQASSMADQRRQPASGR